MARFRLHPGNVLREEFLTPLAMSARQLAAALDVPPNRVTEILNGERGVSADTAIRLARQFGTSGEFWLNLQQAYDLSVAEGTPGEFRPAADKEAARRAAEAIWNIEARLDGLTVRELIAEGRRY